MASLSSDGKGAMQMWLETALLWRLWPEDSVSDIFIKLTEITNKMCISFSIFPTFVCKFSAIFNIINSYMISLFVVVIFVLLSLSK